MLHFCAIAHELDIDKDLIMQEFDRQSDLIPHIARKNPSSDTYDMEDFYQSGGVPRVMEYLRNFVHLDVMTVTGKTLGGLAIMRGNLAPDTGVAKPAAIAEEMCRFTGEAICFDSEEACITALEELKVKPGHVVVIRYEGPKGGPGMREMFKPLKLMNGQGLALTTGLVTDGRFSGTNNGCFVGYVSPEAAVGGPIALVRDGDKITIDVYKKELTLHVSNEKLAGGRAEWSYTPKKLTGYLARYAALVQSADKGGILGWSR